MTYNLNPTFENSELDSYINFDNNETVPVTSASLTPSLLQQISTFSNPQAYAGPSFQYDGYRQQTGFPVGALQQTHRVNKAQGLAYLPGSNGFIVPQDTLNTIPLTNLDDFDFGQSANFDMDIEPDSSADMSSLFYADGSANVSPAQQAPPRIYPGMHTEQAQQAQRQAALEMQRPKPLPSGQIPLPSPALKAKDPHLEESISNVLSKMRQSSNASAAASLDEDEDESKDNDHVKFKKEEEEMDEDERLLNSEEGKKLTSKERRQLRNKVSARAFRSRRKEYIGQLEADLAVKAEEAASLKLQNRQLMEENTRLTDLTRMLLSSKAFAGFLQELGNSTPNSVRPLAQQKPHQRQQSSQPQSHIKDIPAYEAARRLQNSDQNMQVGMTLIPDTPIDASMFDGGHNMFVPTQDFTVFSLAEVPLPSMLNMTVISGKTAIDPVQTSKMDGPIVSARNAEASPEHVVVDGDDLYAEPQATGQLRAKATNLVLPERLVLHIGKTELVATLQQLEDDAGRGRTNGCSSVELDDRLEERLDEWCQSLDEICARLQNFLC